MTTTEIKEFPSVYANIHESVFRSYQLLQKVKEMVGRGDSKETILEIISEVEGEQERVNVGWNEREHYEKFTTT